MADSSAKPARALVHPFGRHAGAERDTDVLHIERLLELFDLFDDIIGGLNSVLL